MATKDLQQEIQRYTLATGEAAKHRLEVLHEMWGEGTRRMARKAGMSPGMKVVDFGCGVGTVSVMFAEMVGQEGHVTGLDMSESQLAQARLRASEQKSRNVKFLQANAVATNLLTLSFLPNDLFQPEGLTLPLTRLSLGRDRFPCHSLV